MCAPRAASTSSTAPTAGSSTTPPGSAGRAPPSACGATTLLPQADLNADEFRQVLGHFCTGVTVITASAPEGPAGFACQAFAALSLEPPLVLFCPSRTSATWPLIERAGHFCANVLADGQHVGAEVPGGSGSRGRTSSPGWRGRRHPRARSWTTR